MDPQSVCRLSPSQIGFTGIIPPSENIKEIVMYRTLITSLSLLALLLLSLTGCTLSTDQNPTSAATPTSTNTPAADPGPSPTPEPEIVFVATVNGEGIRETSFSASLKQFNAALTDFPDLLEEGQTAQEQVLEELVHRVLLAQAARQEGFTATAEAVSEALARITEEAGGEQPFADWLAAQGYTLETFTAELPLELEAAWQRDQIAAGVPDTVEMVRARQILFYDPFQADRAYNQLGAGIPFETVANNNDPDQLGYLDWVPRGVIFYPELEAELFSLSAGTYSEVIETIAGYHILYVYEIDPAHPLNGEARLLLEEQAIGDWLTQQRQQAEVQVLLP
jgi:peptidyl-prolyl cis-trans isomerase C